MQARGSRLRRVVLGSGLLAAVAGATLATSLSIVPARAANPPPTTWRMVALGDSIPYGGRYCANCTSYVVLFARAITRETGHPVTVVNDGVPGLTTSQLLARVRTQVVLRSTIAKANVVTITIGHNDTPWNSTHDACDGSRAFFGTHRDANWAAYSGPCLATVVGGYRTALAGILAEIVTLRAGRPTAIRVTTDYNQVLGSAAAPFAARASSRTVLDALWSATCYVARTHGAICANVYRAFNGSARTQPAGSLLATDHDHASQAGHRVIADSLVALGLGPLRP
jgi:lysophospholipase L1-like esterase